MRMFQAVIQIGQAHPDNVSVTILQGDAVSVDGERMVRVSSGFLHPDAEWCETEADAYDRASVKLLAIASAIGDRAWQLMGKAASLRSPEGVS